MESSKNRKGWIILGVVVGLIVGLMVGSMFATSMQEGAYVQWVNIYRPGDLDAGEGIASIYAREQQGSLPETYLYIKTTAGKIYQGSYTNCQEQNPRCWLEVSALPEDLQAGSDSCTSVFDQMKNPPFPVVQCVRSKGGVGGEFGREIQFALLKDGNVWTWENTYGGMSAKSLMAFGVKCVAAPGLGALIVLAVVVSIFGIKGQVRTTTREGEEKPTETREEG